MMRTGNIALTALCVIAAVSACGSKVNSVESTTSNHVHFLIPSSAGGGLDMTARAVGKSLNDTGLAVKASFQNMPGGGGSRAIAHLIETARRQQDTLLVTSTPSVSCLQSFQSWAAFDIGQTLSSILSAKPALGVQRAFAS